MQHEEPPVSASLSDVRRVTVCTESGGTTQGGRCAGLH